MSATVSVTMAYNAEKDPEIQEAITHLKERGVKVSFILRQLLIQHKNNGYQFGHSCQCKKGGEK